MDGSVSSGVDDSQLQHLVDDYKRWRGPQGRYASFDYCFGYFRRFKERRSSRWRSIGSSTWRNNETHFNHILAVNPNSYISCNNLGISAARRNDLDTARGYFERALAIKPDHANSHVNMVMVLLAQQRLDAAIAYMDRQVELDQTRNTKVGPELAAMRNRAGETLLSQRRYQEASAQKPPSRPVPATKTRGGTFSACGESAMRGAKSLSQMESQWRRVDDETGASV